MIWHVKIKIGFLTMSSPMNFPTFQSEYRAQNRQLYQKHLPKFSTTCINSAKKVAATIAVPFIFIPATVGSGIQLFKLAFFTRNEYSRLLFSEEENFEGRYQCLQRCAAACRKTAKKVYTFAKKVVFYLLKAFEHGAWASYAFAEKVFYENSEAMYVYRSLRKSKMSAELIRQGHIPSNSQRSLSLLDNEEDPSIEYQIEQEYELACQERRLYLRNMRWKIIPNESYEYHQF